MFKTGGGFMIQIPKDPVMLLSFVNTQLRDHYPSMEEFCAANGVEKDTVDAALSSIDYQYDPETNRYI